MVTSDKDFELATRGTSEIVTEEELRGLLARGRPSVYCGYEPSGKIHFGHALTVRKLVDFQKLGARVTVLLADLHAYLNDKGTLEEIRKVAEYNRRCFIGLGLSPEHTKFVLGSEFQLKPEYMMDVLKMATGATILRASPCARANSAAHSRSPAGKNSSQSNARGTANPSRGKKLKLFSMQCFP